MGFNAAKATEIAGTSPAAIQKTASTRAGRSTGDETMNWDTIAGEWKEAKGKLRAKWGKLTDDDFETIAGKKDVLVGRLQQRYGFKRDEAERDVDDFLKTL
jgi:uncharacterized protein YjbJ (UPF0337 family)